MVIWEEFKPAKLEEEDRVLAAISSATSVLDQASPG